MIKRLGKAKKSKQGAILVIVVLILALAMIFISMAMLLTKATRNRLYENTMSSQARLTVTSAAEVFLEALETQEITDDQIDRFILFQFFCCCLNITSGCNYHCIRIFCLRPMQHLA